MELNFEILVSFWEKFIQEQKEQRDDFFWTQYLQTTQPVDYKQNKLQIFVPSSSALAQLNQEEIARLFVNKLPTKIKVEFIIKNKENQPFSEKAPVLKIKKDFTNFVVGGFNKAAYEIAQKIISRKNDWGVIFIYSEPGLGKTYLLKSILQKNCPDFKVIYKHATNFGTEIVDLLSQNTTKIQDYKKSFMESDVLLFDDLQILGERKKTNEILFQIINKAQEMKTDLIFTSDQHPEDLFGFNARLISRFLSGLVIKIDYPDLETAKQIVQQKMKIFLSKSISLEKDVVETIAKMFRKDIRKIEGAVKQAAFFAEQRRMNKVEMKDLKQIFAVNKFNFENKVSIRKIKSVVAKHCGVNYSSLISNSRKKEVVRARYIAIYLLRILTNESHIMIARQFNARNHTTAVNATKTVLEKMKTDPEYAKEIGLIKEKCLND